MIKWYRRFRFDSDANRNDAVERAPEPRKEAPLPMSIGSSLGSRDRKPRTQRLSPDVDEVEVAEDEVLTRVTETQGIMGELDEGHTHTHVRSCAFWMSVMTETNCFLQGNQATFYGLNTPRTTEDERPQQRNAIGS